MREMFSVGIWQLRKKQELKGCLDFESRTDAFDNQYTTVSNGKQTVNSNMMVGNSTHIGTDISTENNARVNMAGEYP